MCAMLVLLLLLTSIAAVVLAVLVCTTERAEGEILVDADEAL